MLKNKPFNIILALAILLYSLLIFLNYLGVVQNMPFTSDFWSTIIIIISLIFIVYNKIIYKKVSFLIVLIVFAIFNVFFLILESKTLRFTQLDYVMKYNHVNKYDYIKVENTYIIFDYENKENVKIRNIIFENKRFNNIDASSYNPIYEECNDDVKIMLLDQIIKNNRIILIENNTNEELRINDNQENEFISSKVEPQKYYVSIIEKRSDYMITINTKEYNINGAIDLEGYKKNKIGSH